MKLKPMPESLVERMAMAFNLAPTPLIETQLYSIISRAIITAAHLGIFEAIGKTSSTVQQIATSAQTDASATKQLLDCLTSIGYLRWHKNQYSLQPKYQKWLLRSSPHNILDKLRFQLCEWNWLSGLEEHVKTGKSLALHSIMNGNEWDDYQRSMHNPSQQAAKELSRKLKLPSGDIKMLDIGGGHGLYTYELCKQHAGLQGTILELPLAMQTTSHWATCPNEAISIQYKTGDALTDDIGHEQYDLILLNNVAHHFTREENIHLARKVKQALKPGGIYAIGELIRHHNPTSGNTIASTAALYFSLTSMSGLWSAEEIKAWQQEVGLKIQKSISLLSLPGWKLLLATKQH